MRVITLVFLVLSSVAVRAQGGECITSELGYTCKKQMTDYYALHWSLGPTTAGAEAKEGEIAIAMVGRTTGWVGVGFPEEANTMAPADVVLGWVDGDEVEVNAYRPRINFISTNDLDDDVTLSDVTAMEKGETTTIRFVRSLKGKTVRLSTTKKIPVNVAIGKSDRLRYHGFGDDRRQSLFVNLGKAKKEGGRMEELSEPKEPSPASGKQSPESETPMPMPPPPASAFIDGEAPASDASAAAPDGAEDFETGLEMEIPQMMPASAGDGCTPSDIGYNCMTTARNVLIHWTLGPAPESGDIPEVMEGEVAMAMSSATDGWVGISFAQSSGSMAPADAIIGWVTGTEATVTAYRITEKNVSPDDATTDIGIRETSGSEVGGTTTIRFVATGNFTFNVNLEEQLNMNWAVGPGDSLVQHIDRGSILIKL